MAAIDLTESLAIGDTILIKGYTANFEQKVNSMQIANKKVEKAKKNDQIGMGVSDKVGVHDSVFKK